MLGLPTAQSAKRGLTGSVDGVLQSIDSLMSTLVLRVLGSRTQAEFWEAFRSAFPDYVRLLRSFSEIAATMSSSSLMVRVSMESLLELEDKLRASGEESFGPAMTERALFTVFTLRKITPLLHSVVTSPRKLDSCDLEKDKDFAENFLVHALVSRFCIDCLIVAMANNRTVYPDVLAALNDLMRSVVNAYAWVHQAVELRTEKDPFDHAVAFPPLDDEDQQLLNESMRDLSLGGV